MFKQIIYIFLSAGDFDISGTHTHTHNLTSPLLEPSPKKRYSIDTIPGMYCLLIAIFADFGICLSYSLAY